jgi:peptidoglycan/xylan/chitin deacetylase (PgdA/CDA1 family)
VTHPPTFDDITPALPILLYHSVSDDPPSWIAPFAVGVREFGRQLDLVVASGRVPVTAADVIAAVRGSKILPDNAVLITFDDGFLDFVEHAMPALAVRELPAALFVTTGALAPGNRSVLPPAPMMSMRQVVEAARAGIEIGAHSHTHIQLDTAPGARITTELARSRAELEDDLGAAVPTFAYPHGYNDSRVRRRAFQAGYNGAFAVRNALSCAVDDPFAVARLTVRADTPLEQVRHWLDGTGARRAPYRESLETNLWRTYRRARMARTARRPISD